MNPHPPTRILGTKLVAYLGSVEETRAVHQWADAERESSAGTEQRLRLALHVARMIAQVDGPRIAAAWFQGLNPPTRRSEPRPPDSGRATWTKLGRTR